MTYFFVFLAIGLMASAYSIGWVMGFKKGATLMEVSVLSKLKKNYGANFENSDGPGSIESL